MVEGEMGMKSGNIKVVQVMQTRASTKYCYSRSPCQEKRLGTPTK